jgi:signal transduction histidine kinase
MDTSPACRDADDPRAAELEVLTRRELGRTAYALARLRLAAAVTLGLLAGGFLLSDWGTWQGWLLLASVVVVGGLSLYDARRLRGATFSPRLFFYVISTVLGFQTIVILTTGGVASPFLVVYVPVAVMAAFTLGRPWPTALFVAALATLVWAFALGALLGPLAGLLPPVLGGVEAAGRSTAYVLTDALVLTAVMVIGALLANQMRGALDRAARAAAAARQEVAAAMRERNRELVALSGAIAHELKNPLASIQGLAVLLARRFPEGGREAEQAGVLLGEVRRMGAILEEFLNFSRPVHDLSLRPVDPAAVLAAVAALHEGVAAARGVTFDLRPDPTPSLTADRRKLEQVLVNLVQNALDASPPGGRVVLRVGADAAGGVQFRVEDDGPGLAAEVRGRLFTPGATTKAAGSGLGLVVARAIAEQHGGALALEERPEGGVRAVCTLPLAGPATGVTEEER